ncbi:MAG: lytic transglycosylase domain-containing protein [Clostridia bacterium]|nr:lytic transglycosylase domain-containing protein [Clostridia bacterium]
MTVKRKRGCFRYTFYILLAIFLLYFSAGNGKEVLLKQIYPTKYQEYVEKYSAEYSLDKNIVYSIIKIESNFRSEVISKAGAKGLMQLMDETAKECSERADFRYIIPEDLFDPEKNIRLGCLYFKSLMDNYGDMELALTAYNGGTGNVDKWLKDENLSDGEGGLSDIPYKETRDYVKKVMRTFDIYNKLYKTAEY